jgi:RNA polymerase sigma-70 factor, ECF subfamily
MADDKAEADITALVTANYPAVYRYAFRLCGSQTDAEDLTQKVFLSAYENIGKLRNIERARSWLFAILRNSFLREYRRQRPLSETDAFINIDHIPVVPPDDLEIEPEQLQEALQQIPEMSRLMLTMFYYEESSYRQIAGELRLPIGTVMSRLARAKGYLRSKLTQRQPERQEELAQIG